MILTDGKLRVRLRLHSEGGINLAELGVLLTSINRTLNQWAGYPPATASKEPSGVEARVEFVQNGSVIIDTLVEFFDAQVAQPGFLQNMLASASYELTGKLASGIRRALSRTKPPKSNPVRTEPFMPELPSVQGISGIQHETIATRPPESPEGTKTIVVEVSMHGSHAVQTVAVSAVVPVDVHRVAIDLKSS